MPETLAQVFSCEFCEISKSTFFTEHLWVTASGVASQFTKRLKIEDLSKTCNIRKVSSLAGDTNQFQ